MSERYEKVLNFLLYNYFGIEDFEKIENDVKSVKEVCAKRAYLDLARTIRYTKTTSELEKSPREEANKYNKSKDALKAKLCNYIVDEIDKYSEDSFDQWHGDRCNTIVQMMNESGLLKEKITYGQAQKWLNMTLKYLWLLGELPNNINEADLHAPIDSYIIEAVESQKDKIEHGLEMIIELSSDSWSKLSDYKEYESFQSDIKSQIYKLFGICPIEWENKAWIEIAKYRANQ